VTESSRSDASRGRAAPALTLITIASLAAAPAAAAAVEVHVRVEGKTRTIFGATSPLINVTPRHRNALPESALDALETASRLGEFYYHVAGTDSGLFVDQIGRIAAMGQTGWTFKVNGVRPQLGAERVRLRPGDTVLWYWAQFGVAGGPKTLLLRRAGRCYTVLQQDDRGTTSPAAGAVLRVGSRGVPTRNGRACIGPHFGMLVRGVLGGAVRSNALP
jgi:hypothetical protein